MSSRQREELVALVELGVLPPLALLALLVVRWCSAVWGQVVRVLSRQREAPGAMVVRWCLAGWGQVLRLRVVPAGLRGLPLTGSSGEPVVLRVLRALRLVALGVPGALAPLEVRWRSAEWGQVLRLVAPGALAGLRGLPLTGSSEEPVVLRVLRRQRVAPGALAGPQR